MLFLVSFLWGFAESTIFFIIPDVILTYIAFFYGIKKGLKASLYAVLGALIGGSLIYFLAKFQIISYHFFEKIPLINEKMILLVNQSIKENLVNVIFGPFKGIPYKLYAYWFGFDNISYIKFIILSFFARIWRFIVVVFIAGGIGYLAKNTKFKHKKIWQFIFILSWIVIYTIYYFQIKNIYY